MIAQKRQSLNGAVAVVVALGDPLERRCQETGVRVPILTELKDYYTNCLRVLVRLLVQE